VRWVWSGYVHAVAGDGQLLAVGSNGGRRGALDGADTQQRPLSCGPVHASSAATVQLVGSPLPRCIAVGPEQGDGRGGVFTAGGAAPHCQQSVRGLQGGGNSTRTNKRKRIFEVESDDGEL